MKKQLNNIKEIEKCIAECSLNLILNPDDVQTLLLRGILLDMAKKFDGAIDDFTEFICKRPVSKKGYYLRAYSFFNKKEFDLAYNDFNKAEGIKFNLIGSVQVNILPQLLGYISIQRAKIISEMEWEYTKTKLEGKYNIRGHFSLS